MSPGVNQWPALAPLSLQCDLLPLVEALELLDGALLEFVSLETFVRLSVLAVLS